MLLIRLFFALLVTVIVTGCSTQYRCAPSKKSRDYARQWVKERPDGYWIVTTDSKFRGMRQDVFECKPDSFELAKLML